MSRESYLNEFAGSRLGIVVHLGLYSLLGRGEWALNREQIPLEEYQDLANKFMVPNFDADDLVKLAKSAGAKYLVFTTMHHEGFALYDSQVNPFNSARLGCRRDLVAEAVGACRRHGLRIHLYHSLNQWTRRPDGVDALEDPAKRKEFVDYTHARIRELVTRFNPIDCLWYDGWWPFDAEGWRSEEMNQMVRAIQPHILFNGRNCLPGDFATPEQHLTAPRPYRPWEACITHNRFNWGYHAGDHGWKSSAEIIDMITQVAAGGGNLLVNIGPDGSGAIPTPTRQMLQDVGQWMQTNGRAIYNSEPFTIDLQVRGNHRGDWMHHGRYTTRGNTLYLHLFAWPGESFSIGGVESSARSARCLATGQAVAIRQVGTRLTFSGLPAVPPHPLGGVLAVDFDRPPALYLTGGLRVPKVRHPRYDPVSSDMLV